MTRLRRRGFVACCLALSCSAKRDVVGVIEKDRHESGPYLDFPANPILDTSGGALPPGIEGDFATPAGPVGEGGPCLVDPPVGALFPRDWLRPRFTFVGAPESVAELRLHAELEAHDLVVYTAGSSWTMPQEMWSALSQHLVDQPITVSVRSLDPSLSPRQPLQGSLGTITIAPAPASGSIVYWTTAGGSALKGFTVGDDAVASVLRPSQASSGTACIGCHASTPDGKYVAFSDSPEALTGDPAHIEMRTVDGSAQDALFITPAVRSLLDRTVQQLPAFSRAHWTAGDRIMVSLYNGQIAWTNLEPTGEAEGEGWGMIARTGDPGLEASHPAMSHDGASIVYTSAPRVTPAGHVGEGDIYMVPFGRAPSAEAHAVLGASEPDQNEFYPVFSADDRWIAYTRLPNDEGSYSNPQSEIFVVPAAGGMPVRLSANDPPVCANETSPGLTNSWPKWSPEVVQVGGKSYYWLIFSSRRGANNPQLYVTAMVVEDNRVSTYPALYLWNQPPDEGNHTPAWDVFQIPPASVR
jgi:mono/diheme cytochrome c family protein